jgi:hypothetical protein
MATKTKNTRAAIARSLHKWNKKRFSATAKDTLETSLGTCETCGNPLELDLFQKLCCGYCGGWRTAKKN